jgi:phage-related tail fiber protein
MPRIVLGKETSTPTTPPSGYVKFYAEGTSLKYVDDTGIVSVLATGVTPEDVQDIVGSFIVDSASIDFTYNDAGNTLAATVIASGVNHNALQNYVANEHINHASVSITAGTGLTGGGDLTATRTVSLANTAVTPGSYGVASSVPTFSVDAQGRLTAASNTPISITSSAVSDFTEAAQDSVGAALLDTSSIDFTYNDAANQISAVVLPAGVNHNALQNYVAAQHVDHSTVSVTAGTGLTGGGDLTASRTISMPSVGTAGTYGTASSVPVLTTDAQGRVSGVTNTPISVTSSAVSDFAEAAQDAVGNILTDSSSIDFVYTDLTNTLTGFVIPGGVDHDLLQNFVANEHINHASVSITAGTGLTGGGDLTATRTLSLTSTGVTPAAYGSATAVAAYAVDAQGRLISASNTTIAIPSTQVTDFVEAAQDAVGNALLDSASIDFQYPDVSNQITAVVLPAGVNHNALQNYVANQHVDHSTVSISPGTGLTGGGDLTATRTLSLADTAVTAGTYGSGAVPQFTVDAQGRITAASNGPALVIGDNFERFEDLTAASTTSSTFATAATFTTTSKQAGTYRIEMSWNHGVHATNNDVIFQPRIDGASLGGEFRREFSEVATQSNIITIFAYVVFATTTTHTIDLQFRTETNASGTLTVNEVRAAMWRVS